MRASSANGADTPVAPAAHGYRGRFAPSPTGLLHLGSAATAIICAARSVAQQGALVLRVEDIDTPRIVRGAEAQIAADLAWLGLSWDEGPDLPPGPRSTGPYRQSERRALYDAAIEELARRGLVYPCDCSRADIARIASAPHAGEDGPRYPGTCRSRAHDAREFRRPPALRLAVPEGAAVRVDDAVLGRRVEDVSATVGDFVLRRGDGVHSYQLAVVVDDVAMGITEVVRGADLASSSARQVLLASLLGASPPRYAHVPLVVGADGARLAKRGRGISIAEQREAGTRPGALIRAVAAGFAHPLRGSEDDPAALVRELAAELRLERLPREPVKASAILDRLG